MGLPTVAELDVMVSGLRSVGMQLRDNGDTNGGDVVMRAAQVIDLNAYKIASERVDD